MPMRKTVSLMLLATVACGVPARTAQAGPLFDWLFGHHRQPAAPAYAVGYPVPVAAGYAPVVAGYAPYTAGYMPYTAGYAPTVAYRPPVAAFAPVQPVAPMATYGTYYGANMPVVGSAGYGYLTQRPVNGVITPAPAVMPSTAPVTLVPDYRSTASRTPVTYYRPLMTTDPTTGQQVVSMAPCSSYEYQTQRVPTWGLTQVYNGGATLPATTAVAPPVSPTYTLPRGGVPLAGPLPSTQPYATAYGTYPAPGTTTVTPVAPTTGSVITPAVTPYSSGYPAYASDYGNYSALQPAVGSAGSGGYPTAPYNNGASGLGPYYNPGSSTGGSCGNYVPQGQPLSTGASPYGASPYGTTPGATYGAPSMTTQPGTVLPTSPTYPPGSSAPGMTFPGYSPVMPPSSDPAAGASPTLPLPGQSSARLDSRPQLQSVVQQPIPGTRSVTSAPSPAQSRDSSSDKSLSPGLMPIPVPEDFKHEPRWNPGLLNEQDQTAASKIDNRAASLKEAAADPSIAWGSKPIHWASFKQPNSDETNLAENEMSGVGLELREPQSRMRDMSPAEEVRPFSASLRTAQPQHQQMPPAFVPSDAKMVPIERGSGSNRPAGLELSPSHAAPLSARSAASPTAPTNTGRYSTGGWQSK